LSDNPWEKPLDTKMLFKIIQNRIDKHVIKKIIEMNKSIRTKSNLRLR